MRKKAYTFHVDMCTRTAYQLRMHNARQIISERGGIRKLARALDHRNHTTVQGWWDRERIPEDRRAEVLAVEPAADAEAITP